MTFTYTIPFVGSHGSMVIGKGGSTIKKLQTDFRCFIKAMKADKENGLPLPYFLIEGSDERAVNHAIIKIQGLLLRSMCRTEKNLRDSNEEMDSKVQHLTLVVADREEQIASNERKKKKVSFKPIKKKCSEDSDSEDESEDDGIYVNEN